jgi:hypothetical protein
MIRLNEPMLNPDPFIPGEVYLRSNLSRKPQNVHCFTSKRCKVH